MKKYLMTVMAAVALGGMFSGCTKEIEGLEGGSSAQLDVIKNYEEAFITRFGQPAETLTWGFGSAASGTRAGEVSQPSVTEEGYTFNAQMAKAWEDVDGTPSYMAYYTSWRNSGWNDKFYTVNGSVVNSTISPKLKEEIYKVIVGEEGKGGLIPEGENNLQTAQSTGYSIVTKGGPVTLTPIYHNSSSGDKISYYYYPQGSTPDVKNLKKYSIGNMADPETCQSTHTALNSNTYSLVYEDASGNVSYDFPPNYVIDFIISNTDLGNGNVEIPDEGANLTSQGKFEVSANEYYQCGSDRYIDGKVQIRLGNQLAAPQFTQAKQGSSFTFQGTNFNWYMEGNGVNGSLDGGSTCYYFRPQKSGTIHVGVKLNSGKKLYIKHLGNEYDPSSYYKGTSLSGFDGKTVTEDYTGVYSFDVEAWNWYAVYAEGSKLGFYGFVFDCKDWQGNVTSTEKDGVFTSALGPFDCGFGIKKGSVDVKLGKTPYFSKPKSDGSVSGYSAYTSGTGKDGGLSNMATTYYFLAWNPGVIRVAVSLKENKRFYIKDLGMNGWNNTSGTSLSGYDGITVSSKYNGTFDFPVEAQHVYAVYAEDSKLGFYGCEFLTVNSSASTKTIANSPEFYGDGNYNVEVHNCTRPLWEGKYHWGVSPATTPHAAVFDAKCTDEDGQTIDVSLIGFEDWTDLDFNDVIFAVTGTKQNDPPVIIEVPDPEPEPICRIITEDLNATVGENDDFDFNDVVFDVCPDAKNNSTILIVRCIGGELPLYIAQAPEDALDETHEVHKICNIGARSMTNTGWDGAINYEKECGRLVLPGVVINSREAAWGIRITVVKKGVPYELEAKKREVPSKICVGPTYKWCHERTNIDDMYHKDGNKYFSMYVAGQLGDDWEKGTAWYQQPLE